MLDQQSFSASSRFLSTILVVALLECVPSRAADQEPYIPAEESVALVEQSPVEIIRVDDHTVLVDFGRVAFGNLKLVPPAGKNGEIRVHFGEKLVSGRIDRKPPGTVRYNVATIKLDRVGPIIAAPPADARNIEQVSDKHPPAVLTPEDWGVVLPFRWVEIEGWPGELKPDEVTRRAAFSLAWDDDSASFECSDETLNQIWDLCRYSIKATTFAGVYVDGDRERIPYEADAYLNQLSHYATDSDIEMARRTYDWLMKHGTWPTEWAPHMVFMAHADWIHTGDAEWLRPRFAALHAKTLVDRAGPDGLIRSDEEQQKRTDIVDWPKTERDGFVFTEVNTVVNAFHLAAVKRMAEMARDLNMEKEADEYEHRYKKTLSEFNAQLIDPETRIYRDGIGTQHSSLHANLFPLAFGLVPEADRSNVVDWLNEREMACSVYAAQYLLEGLFQEASDRKALSLILADTDRSWRHMLRSGTTISWEAWDQKYKPNQDWNHAWGAAPANLLPRFVLGVRPKVAGWEEVMIRPMPGDLEFAKGKVPTPRGPIWVDWQSRDGTGLLLEMVLPEGVSARVDLPATEDSSSVLVDGRIVRATQTDGRWILDDSVSGTATIEVR